MPSERSGRTLAGALHFESDEQSAGLRPSGAPAMERDSRSDRSAGDGQAMSLHVSKLRGISLDIRNRLKRQGISYTHQLLREAGTPEQRARLAARGRIEDMALARLVRRADLARVKGIGAIFADMLEMIGVDHVAALAQQDPAELRRLLYELNAAERLARRAPTLDEVRDWIAQARVLPGLMRPD